MRHAPLSPSASSRWLNCAASVRLSVGHKNVSTQAAKEGTLAHSVAEQRARGVKRDLIRGIVDGPVTDDMLDGADLWAEHLDAWELVNGGPRVSERHIEVPVALSDDCFGTVDAVICTADAVLVADYKYGRGIAHNPADSSQLRLYAAAVLANPRLVLPGSSVEMTLAICQPRNGGWSVATFNMKDVKEWARVALRDFATNKSGKPVAGKHCRFCPAAPTCEAAKKMIETFAKKGENLLLDRMTGMALSTLLAKGESAKAAIAAIEDHARQRLGDGKAIPGFDLAPPNPGPRRWRQGITLEDLRRIGYDGPVQMPKVTAVHSHIQKDGSTAERRKASEVLSMLVERPTSQTAQPRLKRLRVANE